MGTSINILNLFCLVIPSLIFLVYSRHRAKKIRTKKVSSNIEKANQNQDIKDWNFYYQDKINNYIFPALILSNILSIGDSIMDQKDIKITDLQNNLNTITASHDGRLKRIEDYLFSPKGPTTPSILERVESLEKNKEEIEQLMLRVTDPNPRINQKLAQLQMDISALRKEIEKLKSEQNYRVMQQGG